MKYRLEVTAGGGAEELKPLHPVGSAKQLNLRKLLFDQINHRNLNDTKYPNSKWKAISGCNFGSLLVPPNREMQPNNHTSLLVRSLPIVDQRRLCPCVSTNLP